MVEKYIEKYQKDKTEFLDTVKAQLRDKSNSQIETLKKEVGSTIIQPTKSTPKS